MAFSAAFTVAQFTTNPALVQFNDVSSGVDAAITQRRITITDSQNNYIVVAGVTTTYNQWALITNPITLNLLTTDLAVSIRVDWLDVGNNVLYTVTTSYCLDYFNRAFFYALTQNEGLTPGLIQSNNYYTNKAKLWVTIHSAEEAVIFGNDIAASQNQLNIGTKLRLNQLYYFA
jgi:hypothetical protein